MSALSTSVKMQHSSRYGRRVPKIEFIFDSFEASFSGLICLIKIKPDQNSVAARATF